MSAEIPSALLAVAIEAARAGGRVLSAKLSQARTVNFKGAGEIDLVTDADKASEEVVLKVLRDRFPGHAILAEESGQLSGARFTWFVDPLDGTTNYAHAVPHFCVTLGVEGPLDGFSTPQLLAGVVYDPIRDELFGAARGEGATLNGVKIQASPTQKLSRSLLCTGFPYDLPNKPEAPLGLFNRIVRQAQGIRRMGSAALDLAYVACGRFDGYFEFGLKPWDIAAGALLIHEAGGTVRRIDGAPLDVRQGDVMAACAGISAALGGECTAFVKDIGRAYPPGAAGLV